MAASDDEDSEFERFLQTSLSSASSQSTRTSAITHKLPALMEKEEEGSKWLKSGDRNAERERGGRALKLEVAVPSPLPAQGDERERSESVTYTSDFSKDSIEVSSSSTPVQGKTSAKRYPENANTGSLAVGQLNQSSNSSLPMYSDMSSAAEVRRAKYSETKTEQDDVMATPKPSPDHLATEPPGNVKQPVGISLQGVAPVISSANEPQLHSPSTNQPTTEQQEREEEALESIQPLLATRHELTQPSRNLDQKSPTRTSTLWTSNALLSSQPLLFPLTGSLGLAAMAVVAEPGNEWPGREGEGVREVSSLPPVIAGSNSQALASESDSHRASAPAQLVKEGEKKEEEKKKKKEDDKKEKNEGERESKQSLAQAVNSAPAVISSLAGSREQQREETLSSTAAGISCSSERGEVTVSERETAVPQLTAEKKSCVRVSSSSSEGVCVVGLRQTESGREGERRSNDEEDELSREMGEGCEEVLWEAGEGLERELNELQQALKAAGLPVITSSYRQSQPQHPEEDIGSTEGTNDSGSGHVSGQVAGHGSTQVARRGSTQVVGRHESVMTTPQGETEGEGEAKVLGEVARTLAREELGCLARELLFERDRAQRESGTGFTAPKSGLDSCKTGLAAPKSGLDSCKTGLAAPKSGLASSKTGLAAPITGLASSKTGLTAPKSGLTSSKTALSFAGSGSSSPRSSSTGLTTGQRDSVKGKTGLPSSKSGRPVRGLASSQLTRGSGRVRERELEKMRDTVESLTQALSEEQARLQAMKVHTEERERHHRVREKALETSYFEREKALETSYLEREKALQETISQLRNSVEEFESRRLPRQQLKVGGVITEGEREELKRGMCEQETLICGYQRENEKLCLQLNEAKSSLKSVREELLAETQRLRTELANTKAELETIRMRDRTTAPDQSVNKTASQSDDIIRITQLEDQLEQSQDKCHLLERQVVQLKHSLSSYQHLSRPAMEGEREKERGGERKAEREIERENEREKERQELLKEKEGEINELKTKLLTVQKRERAMRLKGGGGGERVKELEKQVRGLNDIIKRRFPNSLSALIIAANTTSSRGENPAQRGREVASSRPGLEARVRQLETELGRREREAREEITAAHERYRTIEAVYQEKVSNLTRELEDLQQQQQRKQQQQKVEFSPEETERETGEGELGQELEEVGTVREETEDLVRELATLRQQLSGVQLKAGHERLKLECRLAETEAEATAAREEVVSLKKGHMAEVDTLKAQMARQSSQSEIASLRSKLSAVQVECHILKQRLEAAEEEREALELAGEREKELTQQLEQLSEQLAEAKRHQTPEMHHFSSLLAKISTLESRITQSEHTVRQRIESQRLPAQHHIKQVERKWRRVVQAKDVEIARFRAEMDTILDTLHALQQQPLPPAFAVS